MAFFYDLFPGRPSFSMKDAETNIIGHGSYNVAVKDIAFSNPKYEHHIKMIVILNLFRKLINKNVLSALQEK